MIKKKSKNKYTKEELNKKIGNNIRAKRKALNLSINEIALFLDINNGYMGAIERGVRGITVKNLIKISKILNTSIEELVLGESGDKKNKEEEHFIKAKMYLDALNSEELDFMLDFIRSYIKNYKRKT